MTPAIRRLTVLASLFCSFFFQTASAVDWGVIDDVEFYGDLRVRYEYFDNNDSADPETHRMRLRARLGSQVQFCNCALVDFRLASGSDDPVSTNQTLKDCFSTKDIRLDLAYLRLQLPICPTTELHLGKMRNPSWEPRFLSPLVYDRDLNPEGIAVTMEQQLGCGAKLLGLASFYIVDEDTSIKDDPWMMDFLLRAEMEWNCINSQVAVGYYFTENLAQADCKAFLGNYGQAGAGPTAWIGDFAVLRLFGEIAMTLSDCEPLCTPSIVTLSAGYTHNFSDDYSIDGLSDERNSWTLQLQYGKAKTPHSWQSAIQYKSLGADSVIDAFTDSDWGRGGSNRKGWVIHGKYAICSWWTVEAKGFFTRRMTDRGIGRREIVSDGKNLTRVQVDTQVRF